VGQKKGNGWSVGGFAAAPCGKPLAYRSASILILRKNKPAAPESQRLSALGCAIGALIAGLAISDAEK
jgi:hypothetical protein